MNLSWGIKWTQLIKVSSADLELIYWLFWYHLGMKFTFHLFWFLCLLLGFVLKTTLQQGHLISSIKKNKPQKVHLFCPDSYLNPFDIGFASCIWQIPLQVLPNNCHLVEMERITLITVKSIIIVRNIITSTTYANKNTIVYKFFFLSFHKLVF